MAKQQTAETLSPLSVVTGATALAVSGQRTIALQNYVCGRRPQTHYASGYLVSLAEVAPTGLTWPVAGTITEVNPALGGSPALVNTEPYAGGWFYKLKLSGGTDGLLAPDAYKAQIGA
jgi:hypothetical protein